MNIIDNVITEDTWDDCLQIACFAIRTNTKTETSRSPAEHLYGFQLRTTLNQNVPPDIEELSEIRSRIYDETQTQLQKYIKQYSQHFNENRKEFQLSI